MTKETRETCWAAKEEYFNCLDKNPNTEEQISTSHPCFQLSQHYLEVCPASWVKHFDEKRKWSASPIKKRTFSD